MRRLGLYSVFINIRLVALCAAVFGCMFSPARLQAQPYAQYGSGVATIHSNFDPLNPPKPSVPIRLPQTGQQASVVIPRPRVISTAEYERLKNSSVPIRLPTGPPMVLSSTLQPVPIRLPLAIDPSASFEGIKETIYTPPSTNIAAGPEDLIQIVNSTVARYTKTAEAVKEPTSSFTIQQWFADFAPVICRNNSGCIYGDVSIRYDQMQGRFIMIANVVDQVSQTSYVLISASNGATYAGGWKNWALNLQLDGTVLSPQNFGDFPQIGFDDKAVYITVNMFNLFDTVSPFRYAKVRIIKKADLYNPATAGLPYKDIYNLKNEDGTTASTLQAPHLRGRPMVKTEAGVMVNASDVEGADYLTLWRINDPTGTPTVVRTTVRGIWPYKYPPVAGAPQPNSAVGLDMGPPSIGKVIMREGKLYVARNTGYVIEPITVTYDLIDLESSKVLVQSRWTNGNFFYPAFDVPATVGPGNDFPNQLIVGTTTKTGGALTFAGMTKMKDGEALYTLGATTERAARWGDYNGAAIDPIDGGMWTSGEYAKAPTATQPQIPGVNNSHYGTWNTYFPWGTSKEFEDVPSTSENFDFVNVMKLWGITTGCSTTPKLYCPASQTSRENLAVFIIRALYGDTFSYTQVPYFTDVPANNYAFPYIQKFRDLGFTNGCSATEYCPAAIATRQHAATFIVRAKMKNLFGEAFTFPTTAYFTDVPSNDPNFSYIQKLRELGITKGCSPTEFCPSSPVTREQMAAFIVRAFLN